MYCGCIHGHFASHMLHKKLLRADFLVHHHLLVDIAGQRLFVADSYSTTPLCRDPATHINVCNNESTPYSSLISEYADVFKPELRQHHGTPAKHGIFHHISTTGTPVHSRFRRLNPQKLSAVKASFAEMERMGICSRLQVLGPLNYIWFLNLMAAGGHAGIIDAST